MIDRFKAVAALALISVVAPIRAQESAGWRDPSPHRIQFVNVDENVRLEVVDWGGVGRPVILLAGLGNTAHVFDDFAPKLTPEYHVYGITRRGYGASTVPASGYGADRLGDDVLAVLDALKLKGPVLAGHSIAGQEMSSVATRYPDRIAGLVYLDAANQYAFDDGQANRYREVVEELQKNLQELLRRWNIPDSNPEDDLKLLRNVLEKNLPEAQSELETIKELMQSGPPAPFPQPPRASDADLESFSALRSWNIRVLGLAIPEAELRQTREFSNGRVGRARTPQSVSQAITAGGQKYRDIRVPTLAIYAIPNDQGPWVNAAEPAVRAAVAAFSTDFAASQEKVAKAFEKGVPNAKVVRLPGANHLVFMSNETDVLREMRSFLAGLQ